MSSMKRHTPKHVFVLVWALVLPAFVVSQISFWNSKVVYAADDTEDIQDSIENLEKKLKKEQEEKAKLQQNLNNIQSSVYATQRDINKTQATIKSTAETISRKENEISQINQRIELQMEVLRGIMQELFYAKKESLAGVIMSDGDFDDILGSSDHLVMLEEKLRAVADEISQAKSKVEEEKIQLAEMKEEHEEVLEDKKDLQQDLLADKAEAASDVAEKEATISELQEKLAELQSDLNKITGKSFNAGDIREAVEYASGKTGVPKGVLYGFLKMETNLGANTGQCTYEQVEKVSISRYKKYGSKYKNSIALLYKRQKIFYDLMDKLDYSKNKKVSCSPSGYIGQGGAMGIPQFMSDVWNGYASQIASKTGHSVPDPWNLTDGVMAMALKLQKAGATSDSASAIKKASINYLGGFHAPYYNGIVYWSKNYKRLFQ